MDAHRFDSLVRLVVADGASRRSALRLLAVGALGAALAVPGLEATAAKQCENCGRRERCCRGKCRNLKKDEKNCGKCGKRCGKGEQCKGGACRGGGCPQEAPIECPAGFKARCCRVGQVCCEKRRICCPQEVPHCCPPADQGFQTPCCPPERPNCCAGAGGCCANGFACKPEGCVLIQ